MTDLYPLANFFNSINVLVDDGVVADESSQYLSQLYDQTGRGEYDLIQTGVDVQDVPDFADEGVWVYTSDHMFYVKGMDPQQFEPDDHNTLHEYVEEHMTSTREVNIPVDDYNTINVNLPDRDYCETTDFTIFNEALEKMAFEPYIEDF